MAAQVIDQLVKVGGRSDHSAGMPKTFAQALGQDICDRINKALGARPNAPLAVK